MSVCDQTLTESKAQLTKTSPVKHASIGPIAVHLPEKVETNDDLQALFPNWDLKVIYEKTGIASRHIAAEDETASDLGVKAAEKLFREHDIDPASIDFLLFCTQTPDYPLPTTACLMQQRLGLRVDIGALDFNLGCSGFVYGLTMADGLIKANAAKRILLITAETYTKYIDSADRSLRTIFGDGAAATLIEASDEQSLFSFRYGTDGTGGDMLFVGSGGARCAEQAIKPRHRKRWKSELYMDGPSLISFTVEAIPTLIDSILADSNLTKSDIECFVFHQATRKMLVELHERLEVDEERLPILMDHVGNTVSSTIPILINELKDRDRLKPDSNNLLVGFGVGLSWAGCLWKP